MWAALLAAVGGIFFLALHRAQPQSRIIDVTIKRGQNTAQIADLLVAKGVISNAQTFRVYAGITQTEAKLQPGRYHFKTGLTYRQILKELTKAHKVPSFSIIIPEGFTAKQIAQRLAVKTKRPAADFYEYIDGQGVSQVQPVELPPDVTTVEGYLFPKTYQFEKKAHPRVIISRMIEQFHLETTSIDWAYAKEKNLSVHQIVTVASLIEREARIPEERPLMAAVIYNRLAKGMPLQLCSTVQYLLPRQKAVLTEKDTQIASPYNTYQQTGLPPGPIASPGIDSIKAALAPASVDYIYFVLTSPEGHHTFTNNYDEFLAAKRKAGLTN